MLKLRLVPVVFIQSVGGKNVAIACVVFTLKCYHSDLRKNSFWKNKRGKSLTSK